MKIVICVSCLTNGGAERVASLWANGFYELGHQVDIILTKDIPITYNVDEGVNIHFLKPFVCTKMFQSLVNDWQYRKQIKKLAPDVIIAVLDGLGPHLALATIGLGIPVIQTEHNSWERPENVKMTFAAKFFKFYANRIVKAVTVLTEADKKVIGNRLKSVYVLPNPLAFEPLATLPSKDKVILAVGRLDAGYTKGFDVLLKAYKKSNVSWRLCIAGGGTEENFAKYKKLAKELNISDKVDFLGFVNNPVELYRKAAIFVLSSRYEGFGMVLIEAMSQGCACIACDYKGRQKEIILQKEQGLICNTDDIEGLSKCIKTLVIDDKYREIVQSESIKRSSFYSLSNIMNRWDYIFKQILNRSLYEK